MPLGGWPSAKRRVVGALRLAISAHVEILGFLPVQWPSKAAEATFANGVPVAAM
jgi:hypothetical protein